MAEKKLLRDSSLTTVINKNVALSDGSRAAGDYDNSTERDEWGDFYLTVQFDTTAPSAGKKIADLYVLYGDGAVTEKFPNGGDGTVGDNNDPQPALKVHSFTTVAPSISANELLLIPNVRLTADTNRIVIKNVSGQQFDETWQLDIKPHKIEIV